MQQEHDASRETEKPLNMLQAVRDAAGLNFDDYYHQILRRRSPPQKRSTSHKSTSATASAQKPTPSKSIPNISSRPYTAPAKLRRRRRSSSSKKRQPKIPITNQTFWSPERRRAKLNKNKNRQNIQMKKNTSNHPNNTIHASRNISRTATNGIATTHVTNAGVGEQETDFIQALALGEKSPTKKYNTSWYKKQFSGEIDEVRKVLELNSKQQHDGSPSIKIRKDAEQSLKLHDERILIDILVSSRINQNQLTSQQHMTPTETATLLATFLTPRATDYERSTFDPSRVYKLLQACRLGKGHLIEFRHEFFQCQSLEAKFVSDVLRLSAELTIYNASCGKNCGKNRSKEQVIIGSPSKIPTTIPRVPSARISTSPKDWHTVTFQRFAPLLAHSLEQLVTHFDEIQENDENTVEKIFEENNSDLAISSTKVSELHDRVQSMVHMMNESPVKSTQKSQDVMDIVASALKIGQWSIDHRRTNEELDEPVPTMKSLEYSTDSVPPTDDVAVLLHVQKKQGKTTQYNTSEANRRGDRATTTTNDDASESIIFKSPMLWLTVIAGTIAGVVFVSRRK